MSPFQVLPTEMKAYVLSFLSTRDADRFTTAVKSNIFELYVILCEREIQIHRLVSAKITPSLKSLGSWFQRRRTQRAHWDVGRATSRWRPDINGLKDTHLERLRVTCVHQAPLPWTGRLQLPLFLRTLVLKNIMFRNGELASFFTALSFTLVRNLELRYAETDGTPREMRDHYAKCPNLKQLRFYKCFLMPAESIYYALRPLSDLEDLRLEYVGLEGWYDKIVHLFSGWPGLRRLDLVGNDLDFPSHARCLARALPQLRLTHLNLSHNDPGFVSGPLLEAIERHRTLRRLDLSSLVADLPDAQRIVRNLGCLKDFCFLTTNLHRITPDDIMRAFEECLRDGRLERLVVSNPLLLRRPGSAFHCVPLHVRRNQIVFSPVPRFVVERQHESDGE